MPSASPESRTKKRRRSRSKSSENRMVSADRKSSNDRKLIKDRDRKGTSRQSEYDRHRMKSPEHRSSGGHGREPEKSVNHRAEHSRPPDAGREHKERDRRKEGHLEGSSLASANVRIKEEPASEDEEARRRTRRSRFSAANVTAAAEEDHSSSKRASGVADGSRPPKQELKDEDVANNKQPKAKVNFGLSGKLAEDTNVFNGIVIKYNEPSEARKPGKRWRLYPFKGDEALPMLAVHRQSAYLLGRERKVADIPIDHPSCSKQHAVLQFRAVQYEREDGRPGRRIRPYIIDLESANGTYVNNARIEPRRYVELFERDVVKFGFSSREYVLLHEGSATADDEDDAPPGDTPERSSITAEAEEDDGAARPVISEPTA